MPEIIATENSAALSENDIDALERSIAHRRSMGIARLKPDPIPRQLIKRVLEAANWAPSHGETEPWRFTVYTGESRRALGDAFAEAYLQETIADGTYKENAHLSQRDRAMSAPVWISIGMQPGLRPDGTRAMSEEDELMATATAAQNLHLMASAQGLAGMWLSKGVMRDPITAAFVGLEPPARLLGFFVLGWPNIPWPQGERGPIEDKVTWKE
jgi:nitroreductase